MNNKIVVRPVYTCRLRPLRGYAFGVFDGSKCVAIFPNYPTEIMRELT